MADAISRGNGDRQSMLALKIVQNNKLTPMGMRGVGVRRGV